VTRELRFHISTYKLENPQVVWLGRVGITKDGKELIEEYPIPEFIPTELGIDPFKDPMLPVYQPLTVDSYTLIKSRL